MSHDRSAWGRDSILRSAFDAGSCYGVLMVALGRLRGREEMASNDSFSENLVDVISGKQRKWTLMDRSISNRHGLVVPLLLSRWGHLMCCLRHKPDRK